MDLPVQHLQNRFMIKTKNLCYKLSPKKNGFLNWGGWWGGATKDDDDVKYILKNVNCEAKPGEITAIAGPSGAGKTTLLEVLAGEIVPSRILGQVLVNDQPLRPENFRKVSGYVTQDEALFPLLTVEETLMYSARLRLHGGKNEAAARVWKLLKELGLDHIVSERIGNETNRGISGGEKRRVSIGVELVHDPAVLLIDEPTSGLDSASALHVMMLLKSMAKNEGKTILLSIHQPGYRILELIDNVVLLSNGFVLHNGPLHFLEDRLKSSGHSIPHHVNVLEFAMDVSENLCINENDVENSEDKEESNHESVTKPSILRKLEEEDTVHYSNSSFKEVWILAQRFSRNVFRTKQLFAARTIQALLAGILLGTIFTNTYNNAKRSTLQTQVGFFAFGLTFLLSSTTEAVPIFLQEKRILMRETSRGAYRISSYIIANTIVFLPFVLIVALLFTSSVYWLVGLRQETDGFLYFSLVTWMVLSMSNSFVACFIALFPDYITGMTMIAAVMGGFYLFSGYFISKENTPKYWIFMHYLSLFKYPLESFLINEFGGEKGRSRCVESVEGVCLLTADGFLAKLGVDESQKWNNIVMMLIFILGYRFLCFVILWYRSYRSRS
ncbi:hypothetical protein M9H77_21158 [Catharanthus roseus]|uniref:Uncharacterized protein n=1 Tax=Catharanthus roseus TaxID=4058 RepID=A0ACC0ANL2_CATRO|nr:hypothetical protein M9H77_21158 [Catharanthus roseus]